MIMGDWLTSPIGAKSRSKSTGKFGCVSGNITRAVEVGM